MKSIITLLISGLLMTGCSASSGQVSQINQTEDMGQTAVVESMNSVENIENIENLNYVKYVSLSDIKKDVGNLDKKYVNVFDKYIQYIAPNKKAITILAQDKVTDEQVLKAYNVLSFYLTNHKAYDMTLVASRMAENGAILMMPNGADGDVELTEDVFTGQPLYQLEVPVTGDQWYINNNYEHRDASYEEILHLVHDYGIGTTAAPGALPRLQKAIAKGTKNALPSKKSDWGKKGLWGLSSKDWLVELAEEGSLEQEYIVSVVDSYYGLWQAFDENDGGMWGIYVAKNREEIGKKDPVGLEILESFLPQHFSYMDRISPTFEGTFQMTLDPNKPYTYKSQYIKDLRLTGEKNSHINANELDNILMGNAGNNIIDGQGGQDILQVSGHSSDYDITRTSTSLIIKDKLNRDGEDTLKNIEIIRFLDKDMSIK